MDTINNNNNNRKIDLKAAINAKGKSPQGTLEEIEKAATPKKGRSAPRKDPKDKIAQKIVVGFTQAEFEAIEAAAQELEAKLLTVPVSTSFFVKHCVLEKLKSK